MALAVLVRLSSTARVTNGAGELRALLEKPAKAMPHPLLPPQMSCSLCNPCSLCSSSCWLL